MSWLSLRRGWALALGLVLATASGCGEDEAPPRPVLSVFDTADGSATDAIHRDPVRAGQDPIVESIAFEPSDPESESRIRAIPRVSGEWSYLRYEWTVNGESFGADTARVQLPHLARGDTVGLRVTPFRESQPGQPFDVEKSVANQKPRIRGLRIERVGGEESGAGGAERWQASIDAADPDGDPLEMEYEWFVNGVRAEEEDESTFSLSGSKPGDRIGVHGRAFDGRLYSATFRSGEIEVGHIPPTIVSTPPRPDATGYFRYAVTVKDAFDPSTLRFELRKAPAGMEIDEHAGVVTWHPGPDQAGRHEVEIVVRNEQGGEATQAFGLALVSVDESDQSPAAPR